MEFYKKLTDFLEKYQQNKIKLFLANLNVSILMDVGSFKGNYIKNLNKKKIKKAYLFEPQPFFFKYLKKKFKKYPNYKIFNLALSSKKKTMDFLINSQITTSSLEINLNKSHILYKIKSKILKLDYHKRIKVKTNLLQNILKNKSLKNSLLKIDTEGHDLETLRGASKIINKIDYIIIEVKYLNFYKNNSKKDIYNFLINKKFEKVKSFSTFPYIYQDVLFKNRLKLYNNK